MFGTLEYIARVYLIRSAVSKSATGSRGRVAQHFPSQVFVFQQFRDHLQLRKDQHHLSPKGLDHSAQPAVRLTFGIDDNVRYDTALHRHTTASDAQ